MRSKHLAALAVAALVLTAGCSFLGGDGTPGGSGSPAAGSFEYPPGYAASGVSDAEAAVAAHEAGMLSLDNYTLTYVATVNTSQSNISIDYVQRADAADERALLRSNYSTGRHHASTTQFYAGDAVYVRSNPAGANNTRYANASRQFNATELTGLRFVRPMLTNVTYGEAELVSRSGETWAKYEADSLGNASALAGNISSAEMQNFSAVLWVDDAGLVRRVQYEASVVKDGETRTVTVAVEVTAVGETAVQRPDWTSKA